MTFRRRLYLTLDPTEKGGIPERIFEVVLICIILLNIFAIVADSVQEIAQDYHELFNNLETLPIFFFTVEYIARLY